jgi:MoaA/NifB/PqqE/SkfB family radical SAM enzyme
MFEMKKKLPDDVYLWINAYKHDGYYDETDMEFLGDIDRYFFMNNRNYESENEPCMTGEKVFSVRNDGNIYRCHFDEEILGNIKEDDINLIMQKRLCKKKTCNCHIGFVFMEKPGFDKVYGKGLLERNPYLK